MRLSELLKNILAFDPQCDIEITGIAQDSRHVKPGDLFLAYPGLQTDGRKFVTDAVVAGAAAILIEEQDNEQEFVAIAKQKCPLLAITKLAEHIGIIAARFYQHPSHSLQVIGVTGTSGKTTCTQLLANALQLAGQTCGVIGTLGYGLVGHLQTGALTTPDAVELQRLLAEFKMQGAQFASMEISSHRLAQRRINGLEVKIAVFTNLSRDHLDYHGDMQNYAQTKRSLFNHPGLAYGVLNADDAYGQQWLKELSGKLPVYAYSLDQPKEELKHIPHIYLRNVHFDTRGFTASVCTPWGDGVLHNSYLIGRFNLANVLAVLTVLGILGIPLQAGFEYIAQLRGVIGRMETFGGNGKPLVVVDYAHKPDALEQVLQALKQDCRGKLWCVFGCGGNRDRGKRPLMAKVAEQYADYLVITDDNPRSEDPRLIVTEIMQGLVSTHKVVVEHDRRRAIAHAVSCAQPEDTILIAGKGHETYQIIGNEKIAFSDALEAQLLLQALNT